MNSQKDDAYDSDAIPKQILHISILSSNTMTSTPTKNDYEEKLSPIINICNESNLWQEITLPESKHQYVDGFP